MSLIDFMPQPATGSCLDRIAELNSVCRASYGPDQSVKPNDNCYWDNDLGLWMEDDATFRVRIRVEVSK